MTSQAQPNIEDIELSSFTFRPTSSASRPVPGTPSSETPFAPALPPVDSGRQAWLFLLSATMIEALVWGLPYTVGVLHAYWTNTLFEGRGSGIVTLAATLQTGLVYMSLGVFGPIFAALPRWERTMQAGGLLVASASLVASAFVTQLTLALYLPCAVLVFEWFHAKRGLASGILYAGTGLGGALFPFIVAGLLSFGYKPAMISIGLGWGIVAGICMIPIKRRVPIGRYDSTEPRRERPSWKFMRSWIMWSAIATIGITSLGNFLPTVWLPTFAEEKNIKPSGVALVSIMNAVSIAGNTLLGALTDRYPIHLVINFTFLTAALACFVLWGFGTNIVALVAFVLVFGLVGLTSAALWTKMISIIARDESSAPALIFPVFAFVRGIGNIIAGPISSALLRVDALRGKAGAYGFQNYGVLLIFTGMTIISGSVTGMAFRGSSNVRAPQ
ncbi:hypothetical protein JCM24511_02078 [Saitozyma sp. JCM 24511]|nr:hypothetical protein JCM24511_02078 [Saitozyma sp. JCM 24511]